MNKLVTLVFKPVGRLNRRLFLLLIGLPIFCFILIEKAINSWTLRTTLIKAAFNSNIPWLNFIPDMISALLLIFLGYLLTIASVKRCRDIGYSEWWLFIIPGLYIAALLLVLVRFSEWISAILGLTGVACMWGVLAALSMLFAAPANSRSGNLRPLSWINTALLFVTLTGVLFFDVPISTIGSLYLHVSGPAKAPLCIWNQSNRYLNLEITTLEGVVHQRYNTTVPANEIVKYEDILFRSCDYTITATDSTQKVLFTKSLTQAEVGWADWVIIIPNGLQK
jgi:uncharacterized membrane protein YhaH (DUF805 family)